MRNNAIITAAGSGRRFNSKTKKQFTALNGIPILIRTIRVFYDHDFFAKIIITLPPKDIASTQELIFKYFKKDRFIFAEGGKTRQKSVYNALSQCSDNTDFVAIHDGVRPLIKTGEIDQIIEKAKRFDAAIPVTKIKYTIKEIDTDFIKKTLDRNRIVNVHTPQIFRFELIKKYHNKARKINQTFTDDAGILEYFGINTAYTFISEENIKITRPIDLFIAEKILEKRGAK
mgnify:CR=1 FL=1